MEIINEPIEILDQIAEDKKNDLASKISGKFKQWDDDRNSQIATAREIITEVSLNQAAQEFDNEDLKWKSDVKLNALYNIKRAKKSMMWAEMWSNADQMFDVQGTDKETEKLAKIQKAAIVDSLNKMEIQKQYDIAADDLFNIGEMIFKTDWEQRRKIVKRQRKDIGFMLMELFRTVTGAGYSEGNNMKEIEIPYYENARVEAVSPFMFVFDHTKFKPGNQKNWDSLWKIYKRFDTLDNIKNNKVYTITDEMLSALGYNNTDNQNGEKKKLIDLRDIDEYSGQISVLYCHGDFKIDGKLYKNYIAEVLGGRFLIRFEENPLYINPFIYCALEYDPETKRGISPLKCALSLSKEQNRLANTAMDVQKLKANPPIYADEDFFDDENTESKEKIELFPGKIIKIKNNYSGGTPVEVKLSGEGISDLINFSDQKISDLTSVSNFMYGNVTDTKRTATELSLVDKGASSQTAKELDIINQDLTIPMIKNVSELLAMFKDGNEYIYTKEKGENVEYKITNAIRQAQYEYKYEDRNAIENRKTRFEQALNLMQSASQNAELFQMFNWREIFTTAFEMLGFDNPEKFFNEDVPAELFAKQLKQLPPQLQEQIINAFSQELQGMLQNAHQNAQMQQMQEQAQKDVQMQNLRNQYRNEAQLQLVNSNETANTNIL